MRDKKRSQDSNTSEDWGLIDGMLITKRAMRQQQRSGPCPQHEERESLIWAYADDFLEGIEEDEAWGKISQCRHCLDRLAAIHQALREAEERMEPRAFPDTRRMPEQDTARDSKPVSILRKEWILALFDLRWAWRGIKEKGRVLATTELQLVPLLGEEEKIRRGQLSYTWNDLAVTIATELHFKPQDRMHGIKVSIDLRDQIGQSVSQMQIDFCDIYGVIMETSVTDDAGHVTFSSQEGQRFVREEGPQVDIGFCLELTRSGESASWQTLIGQGSPDMTTRTG